MKKEIYVNLSHKQPHEVQDSKKQSRKTGIISMAPVNPRNVEKKENSVVSNQKDASMYDQPNAWK
jgi:hypothetical protein